MNEFVFVGWRIAKRANGNITLGQSHYAADLIIAKVKQDHEAKMGKDRSSAPLPAHYSGCQEPLLDLTLQRTPRS